MKQLLGICLLAMCVGCAPEPPQKNFDFELRIGQDVDVRLGVIGEIVDLDIKGRRYKVRVNTPNGVDIVWLREADVEVVIE